jgi:tetratricopeptide (TPR) repeat protein
MSDLAKASFSRALALAPGMADAQAALASLTAAAGENDEALRLAGSALQQRPGLPLAELANAKALMAKGEPQQAEAALENLLKQDPTSLPALAQLLNLYLVQGKTAQAVERIAGLVRQNPQNAGLHFLLALGYFDLKDLDKSEASLKQAMALDPKTPQVYSLLGNIHLARGAVEQAKQDFRHAIEANPYNLSNYLALEAQYQREGNWEEAKKLCEKAHEIDPESAIAAGELAFLYLDHGGDVNLAFSLAQKVKQKMPRSPLAADTLGWAYYKLGSFDSAVAQLKESVKSAPNNAMFAFHLGMAYLSAHQSDAARRTLQKSLQDDPHSPFVADIKGTLGRINQATK